MELESVSELAGLGLLEKVEIGVGDELFESTDLTAEQDANTGTRTNAKIALFRICNEIIYFAFGWHT
jgi:hypothetical protein